MCALGDGTFCETVGNLCWNHDVQAKCWHFNLMRRKLVVLIITWVRLLFEYGWDAQDKNTLGHWKPICKLEYMILVLPRYACDFYLLLLKSWPRFQHFIFLANQVVSIWYQYLKSLTYYYTFFFYKIAIFSYTHGLFLFTGDAYLSTCIYNLTASRNLYYGVQVLTGTTKLAGYLSLWSLKYCCQQLVLASLVG